MNVSEPITLTRDLEAIEIPSGIRWTLACGAVVRILQSLGGSYTVTDGCGRMYRVDAKDAEALGDFHRAAAQSLDAAPAPARFSEQMVWDQLKTVYDPEIPVNIVDLGLIYACEINPLDSEERKIDVKMSLTAPGCGMGNILRADVETKLRNLPTVKEVNVEVVLDPPWHPGMMSQAAKLQLGFDLDYDSGPAQSPFPVFPEGR